MVVQHESYFDTIKLIHITNINYTKYKLYIYDHHIMMYTGVNYIVHFKLCNKFDNVSQNTKQL